MNLEPCSSRASSSTATCPRIVESIFLKITPASRRPPRARAAAWTASAAAGGASARLPVSTASTARSSATSRGAAVTPTAPAPANRQPVSQAPVRSSARIVTWKGLAAMSASPYHRNDAAPTGPGRPGRPRNGVYTDRVKSRVVVALLALAAALLPARFVLAEDPVAALSLIRPRPAKEAPDFQARTPDDHLLRLADYKGKVVFLNFWATWCEPCREEMPGMERLHRAYKDRGLVVLAISLDSQGASVVNPFVKKLGLTFPVALDPKMAVRERYGVWAVPSTFIIDRRASGCSSPTARGSGTARPRTPS